MSVIEYASTAIAPQDDVLCRTRRLMNASFDDYNLDRPVFNIVSCIKCAAYLDLNSKFTSYPNAENASDLQSHCNSLSYTEIDCKRWTKCCTDAVDCCRTQTSVVNNSSGTESCPSVWDGYSCIPVTMPNKVVKVICPSFIYHDMDPGPFEVYATKTCTIQGEWAMFPARHGEYTDYLPCVNDRQEWDETLNKFKIVCECLSIVMLATSIFCFMYCRRLRERSSYRVHTQMLVAMILYSISCLLRETIVHYFVIVKHEHRPGCETITMMVRWFMITAYSAMTVEAFYLHWTLAKPLQPFTKLRSLIVIGWSMPIIVIAVYIPLRIVLTRGENAYSNYCWINPWGNFEFLIYGPNFACLLLNIIFLLSLLRITCNMQDMAAAAPRSSLGRRASARIRRRPCDIFKRSEFRAMITFTLLFGVPQALVLIRPSGLTGIWFKSYELISVALQMLQGSFASILLCYLNLEVRTEFCRTALGIVLVRQRDRYESIVSSISTRVRNSVMERRQRSAQRSSNESHVSYEVKPMLRVETNANGSMPEFRLSVNAPSTASLRNSHDSTLHLSPTAESPNSAKRETNGILVDEGND